MFSNETIGILKTYKWDLNRKEDISELEEFFQKNKFELNDLVKNFIRNFYMLDIKHYIYCNDSKVRSFFDPIYAFNRVFVETIDSYVEIVGEDLIVIGEGLNGMLLMMSLTGKIYAGFESYLYRFGEGLEESVNNLICGNKPIQLSGYHDKRLKYEGENVQC